MEFDINAVTEMILNSSGIDVVHDVRGEQLIADGDTGGTASTNTITGATDTPTAYDETTPDGYIKAYVGTQAVTIPYWNT
jgi:hypothetical protein